MHNCAQPDRQKVRRLALVLGTLALAYAALVNVRTVVDTDIGWQLATGRYILQHGQVPYRDVLSYTAQGKEWIYPVLSGVVFYLAVLAGGFASLSLLGVAACLGTAGLLLRRAGPATAALALIAAPAIGFSTLPRANMFTPLLFAAFFGLLWRHQQGGHARLWLLPILMAAWVNLHAGFEAGLAALAGYLALELAELPFRFRREAAVRRLRHAAPWLAAAAGATLLNPWGPRIYAAIPRQKRLLEGIGGFVSEWTPVSSSPAVIFRHVLDWRSPFSAYWWLLGVAVVAVAWALWRRQLGAALLLAGASFASFHYLRFHGLFAIVVVTLAGSALDRESVQGLRSNARRWTLHFGLWTLAAVLLLLTATRVADLVSNRYYLSRGEIAIFGVGASRWYPERAAAFVLREQLPGRVWNSYDSGGYLAWRLGPAYPVYIDGRAIPFGPEMYFRNARLTDSSPDSAEWRREADAWGINTAIFGVARYAGAPAALARFCESRGWIPVYIDETAAVFVRNRPENAAWTGRLRIDCRRAGFAPPASPNAAERYNFHADAGSALAALGRHREALEAFERAERIFANDRHLLLMKSATLQAMGRPRDAEAECRAALALGEDEQGWLALAAALAGQARYAEAAEAIERAMRFTTTAEMYRLLGEVRLAMQLPQRALDAFSEAERLDPYRGAAAANGAGFRAQLAMGRAHAYFRLGDLDRAVYHQQQATALEPDQPARWLELAELYQALARDDLARQARERAQQASR